MTDVNTPAEPVTPPPTPQLVPQTPPPASTPAEGIPQAEVDALIGRTKGETKSKVTRDLTEALGMPVEEAAQIIAAHKELQESQKTNEDRLIEATTAAQAEVVKATRTMAEATLERDLTRALFDASDESQPLLPSKLTAAILMGVPYAISLGEDSEAVSKAVAFIRGETPEWFAGTSGEPTPPPPTPRPPGRGPGTIPVPPADDPASRAKEWAARYRGGAASSPVPSPRP